MSRYPAEVCAVCVGRSESGDLDFAKPTAAGIPWAWRQPVRNGL